MIVGLYNAELKKTCLFIILKDIQHKNEGSNTEWLETLERKKPNCMTNSNYNSINLSHHLNIRKFNPEVIEILKHQGQVRKGSEQLGGRFDYKLE